jgi:hypothetical protein
MSVVFPVPAPPKSSMTPHCSSIQSVMWASTSAYVVHRARAAGGRPRSRSATHVRATFVTTGPRASTRMTSSCPRLPPQVCRLLPTGVGRRAAPEGRPLAPSAGGSGRPWRPWWWGAFAVDSPRSPRHG